MQVSSQYNVMEEFTVRNLSGVCSAEKELRLYSSDSG